MAGAMRPPPVEAKNLSLRGVYKEPASCSWTLPKRWQACVVRRIAFYVASAGNPHHEFYVLKSKGSIPEKGCILGV